jgi:hypothetical protein
MKKRAIKKLNFIKTEWQCTEFDYIRTGGFDNILMVRTGDGSKRSQ